MEIGKRFEVDRECSEKGRMWNDYIIHLSNALQMGHIPMNKLLVSFDVLISLMHYATERLDQHEYCRFRLDSGEPADIEAFTASEKYYYYTANDRVEVIPDLFAHPDTVEFV
jgi:hypothetical protein